MGEVYRAKDTKLGRDVALKILPASFTNDPERVARFRREAQVLASLNHPHIAQIYGLEEANGMQFLVLELVDGESLDKRIVRGRIPLDEALGIAKQIAEALEAAHEKGIIHRDLKPANIALNTDGNVKVLDFGLAKAIETGVPTSDVSMSPTITTPVMMTGVGVILGTAAYMSPEQAKGRAADRRSDIWAFGCVLYEMLTGTRAFDGEDVSETLAAVLRGQPAWEGLPRDVSPSIVTLLQRCLEKAQAKRISNIGAATFVLNEQPNLHRSDTSTTADVPQHRRQRFVAWLIAAVFATACLAIGVTAWILWPQPASSPALVRFSVLLEAGLAFSGLTRKMVAISPDGTQIVYVANTRLHRRSLDDLVAHEIAGTENVAVLNPVFSPDGKWIAFFGSSASGNAIMRIPQTGGPATTIARVDNPYGMSWGERGIVYAADTGESNGIFRVSPDGGTPAQLVRIDVDQIALSPQVLPGGENLMFTLLARPRGASLNELRGGRIVLQSLASGARATLVSTDDVIAADGVSDAQYLSSGHLVFAVSGSLYGIAFDPKARKTIGDRIPILAGVRRSTSGVFAQFALSEADSLVYVPGSTEAGGSARRLVTLSDRSGATTALKLPPGRYEHPRVSPDGTRLAVDIEEGGKANISIYELTETTSIRRLTLEGQNRYPVWSSDGQRVAFQSDRDGDRGIFWQRADGTGLAERLTTASRDAAHIPESMSPDGRHLLFTERRNDLYQLQVLSIGDRTTAAFGGVKSHTPTGAVFAPNGRWVAYASTNREAGLASRDNGIFLQPFPATGATFQLPKVRIDYHPAWTPDGNSLLFVASSLEPLVVVDVHTQQGVTFGKPVALPQTVSYPGLINSDVRGFDIAHDGRIISLTAAGDLEPGNDGARREIRVVQNWLHELKARVPTK
jgi:serine/threonine-protein kinase